MPKYRRTSYGGKSVYGTATVYDVLNEKTGRQVTFRSPQKFRAAAVPEAWYLGRLNAVGLLRVDRIVDVETARVVKADAVNSQMWVRVGLVLADGQSAAENKFKAAWVSKALWRLRCGMHE